MNPVIGHNGGPNIEGRKESLRTTWAKALFADPETPVYVMAIAWAIHWYSRADGTGAALSNAQLKMICGISEPTATRGKRWLRDNGYVQLKVGSGDTKTQFRMSIPVREIEQERVIPQITLPNQPDYPMKDEGNQPLGNPTDEGHQEIAEGNQTDDHGVIPQTTSILYRDSISIQDSVERKGNGNSYWKKQLNPEHLDYEFDGEKLTLLNGTKTRWLLEFHDDEKGLDLALKEVAGRIQPNGSKAISVQVEASLAKIAREANNQTQRYERARASRATQTKKTETPEQLADRIRAVVGEKRP